MILLLATAFAVPAGPARNLTDLVATEGDGASIELTTGVYTQTVVIDAQDVTIRAAPGALVLFVGNGPHFEVSGGLTLEDVRFIGFGGDLIAVGPEASLVARGVDFTLDGGSRALRTEGVVELEQASIDGGIGVEGGQIQVQAGTLIVRDSRLTAGGAQSGGSVWVGTDGNLSLTGVTLEGHRAGEGGAVHCAGTCEITESLLADNVATSRGGALRLTDGAHLSLGRTELFRNRAATGGAVYGEGVSATISRSTFCANEALEASGGAAYLSFADDAFDARIGWTRFIDNEAAVAGGALFLEGAPQGLFHLNLLGNAAREGAAVYAGLPLVVERSLVGASRLGPAFTLLDWSGTAGSRFFANGGENVRLLSEDGLDDEDRLVVASFGAPLIAPHVVGAPCEVPADFHSVDSSAVESVRNGTQADAIGSDDEVGAYVVPSEALGIEPGHPAGLQDRDQDGWVAAYDCDDEAPRIHPRPREEVFEDGLDDACDGGPDDDADGDGYGAEDDCDDSDASVNPGANDRNPRLDRDCDGYIIDEVPALESGACDSGPASLAGGPLVLAALFWRRRRGPRWGGGGPLDGCP